MSRPEILAGRAFVELFVKDSTMQKGLRAAQARLQQFGRSVALVGAFVAAAGGAMLAPLIAAVRHFVDFGSVLNDTAGRTGVAASALAEYAYAAEETSATLADVEAGLRFMAKSGSLETFDQAAARIAAIQDPILRAAEAIKTWGKSGTILINMAMDLQNLRAEARRLGVVFTPEQVALADKLGDALGMIKTAVFATAFQLGAALAPALIWVAEQVKNVAVVVGNFARNNPALTRIIAAVGAFLVTLGTALVVIGGVAVALGAVISGIVTLGSVAATVIGALTSVSGFVVLIVAAVAAAVAQWTAFYTAVVAGLSYFLFFTQAGKKVVAWFAEVGKIIVGFGIVVGVVFYKAGSLLVWFGTSVFKVLLQLIRPLVQLGKLFLSFGNWILQGLLWPVNRLILAFSGMGKAVDGMMRNISTALKAGDFQAAWKIAMAGMEQVWHEFAATVLEGLAMIAEQMYGLNLLTGSVIPAAIHTAAKGERLSAKIKGLEAARLAREAGRTQGDRGSESNSYPNAASAKTIGYNARAALMGRQILGAGRNPVVDALKAGLKLDQKVIDLLDSIERHLVVPRFR